MKLKTTKKSVMESYPYVISVPYCKIQHLLSDKAPLAYTCSNKYGWRADVYIIEPDVAIVTGYAPFGNISAPLDICLKWDCKALKTPYSADALRIIRYDFVREVLEHEQA